MILWRAVVVVITVIVVMVVMVVVRSRMMAAAVSESAVVIVVVVVVVRCWPVTDERRRQPLGLHTGDNEKTNHYVDKQISVSNATAVSPIG